MARARVTVEPGVCVGTAGFRRTLGIIGGQVRYSVGGDHNRTCQVATFRRWIARTKARRQGFELSGQ